MRNVAQEKQWIWVAAALAIPHRLAATCAIFGFVALAGYFGNIEELYRPIAGGPATNPLTAFCVLLLDIGLSISGPRGHGSRLALAFAATTSAIALAKLAEPSWGTDLTTWITPFQQKVLLDQHAGGHNSMGVNSAFMLLLVGIALALYNVRLTSLSQITASVAVAIPTISFTGYAYGLERFYGQMSLLTATTGFGLALATLALTADHGGLRAILSPYIGGQIARVQALVGYILPTALGYLLVKSVTVGSAQSYGLFGIFVVTICWFIILMVGVSAIFHEKVDFARRQGETKLALAALSDSLTGLPNRRMFFHHGEHEIERMKRTQSALWILMIDLDFFKKINDTAGHAMGDQVLIAVSGLLSSSIRKVDLVGRIGGEEFAILITDTNQRGCERVAEHIRESIEQLPVPGWTDIHGRITASIGCAPVHPAGTLDAALQMADDALYVSKKRGRNQVTLSNTPDALVAPTTSDTVA